MTTRRDHAISGQEELAARGPVGGCVLQGQGRLATDGEREAAVGERRRLAVLGMAHHADGDAADRRAATRAHVPADRADRLLPAFVDGDGEPGLHGPARLVQPSRDVVEVRRDELRRRRHGARRDRRRWDHDRLEERPRGLRGAVHRDVLQLDAEPVRPARDESRRGHGPTGVVRQDRPGAVDHAVARDHVHGLEPVLDRSRPHHCDRRRVCVDDLERGARGPRGGAEGGPARARFGLVLRAAAAGNDDGDDDCEPQAGEGPGGHAPGLRRHPRWGNDPESAASQIGNSNRPSANACTRLSQRQPLSLPPRISDTQGSPSSV